MVKHIKSNDFNKEVIESNKLIIVDFFATWCGPCQMLGEELEKVDFDIVKVNIDEERALALQYDVQVVPTIFIFKNGNIMKKIEGYISKEEITEEMKKYL